jgi:hypothetical protein
MIYICGDSFCSQDKEYGNSWVDLLMQKTTKKIVNLSRPGASNYLIYLQVKQALANNATHIIYHATSSIRHEFSFESIDTGKDNINRYWNVLDPDNHKKTICTSWSTPLNNTLYNFKNELTEIYKFGTKFLDLPSTIEKNYIYILFTLRLVQENNHLCEWVWSRGGFEHKKFNSSSDWDFSQYQQYESKINLWDHYNPSVLRPYYHITDTKIHQDVCNLYYDMLKLKK